MRALFEALDPLYQFKISAAYRVAIIAFKLTILSSHKADNTRCMCNDKMAKQTIFEAIQMARTY